MTDAWRNHYDAWKLSGPAEPDTDDDGNPIDPDEEEAAREAAEEARAARNREDLILDRDNRKGW